MHGKMVLEIRPTHADKGTAIDRFLETPPFVGRLPVFAGDDITDEDGVRSREPPRRHQHQGGNGGDPEAAYRVPDVAALHDWLATIASARRHD